MEISGETIVDKDFIKKSYANKDAVLMYSKAVKEIGLWKSEILMFDKYFNHQQKIIDIGCGTGRTTIAMYELGYKFVEGLDLSSDMLNQAQKISDEKQCNIVFHLGDATNLDLEDASFDGAIFSFNGIMQIPKKENRVKAMSEIRRVIKDEGYFIFTTHDINIGYKEFWEEEKIRWQKGIQSKDLIEFGDIVEKRKNKELFIHIPTKDEVISCIEEANLKLVEVKLRSQMCDENEKVMEFSKDCIFWVVKK